MLKEMFPKGGGKDIPMGRYMRLDNNQRIKYINSGTSLSMIYTTEVTEDCVLFGTYTVSWNGTKESPYIILIIKTPSGTSWTDGYYFGAESGKITSGKKLTLTIGRNNSSSSYFAGYRGIFVPKGCEINVQAYHSTSTAGTMTVTNQMGLYKLYEE